MANFRIPDVRRLPAIASIFVILALIGSVCARPLSAAADSAITVTFIDVGQGDAILVSTDDGRHMLVDGGPKAAGGKLVATLHSMGVEHLDVVVSTHPHEDHVGGLIEVLDSFAVGKVLDSAKAHTSATYEAYLSKIYEKGIAFSAPRAGDSFDLGPVTIKVRWPTEPLPQDINDSSLVLEVAYGKSRILLTGDISGHVERILADTGVLNHIHLLKVSHHGSRTSTTQTFLAQTSPRLAVIQVGQGNDYGHPSNQVLTNLRSRDVLAYRTDEHGTVSVKMRPDGKTFSVHIEQPGNDLRASSSSDVFHRSSCRYVNTIDASRIVMISDREQAMNAGYRPCKLCNP